ncbi:MAG: zf-TFIIB domain-containing protein [Sulfolobales archaeon]
MKAVVGPFIDIRLEIDKTKFVTHVDALVPEKEVLLDNKKICRILYVEDKANRSGFYFVVYETDNLDFYRPYLAKIPERYEELNRLVAMKCPRCGSTDTKLDEEDLSDTMIYCFKCRKLYWDYDEIVVWKRKEVSDQNLVEGDGIQVIKSEEYVRFFKKLSEGDGRVGNIDVRWIDFIGYRVIGSFIHDFGIYRKILPKTFEKPVIVKIGNLSERERSEVVKEIEVELRKSGEKKKEDVRREQDSEEVEKLRKELKDLPISLNIGRGVVEVKLTQRVDEKNFKRFIETCRKLGFRFNPKNAVWYKYVENNGSQKEEVYV